MTNSEGHPRRWAILLALCAALLIVVIDNTVLNVALPAMTTAFDASTAELQAVLDAYVVVFAGFLVAGGVGGDRYGRRRTILAGLLLFGFASAAAMAASEIWWLIAMRGLMGLGAALVMPGTLAVIVQVFPAGERPKAFAAWAAVAAGAMAAGPVLGGLLVDLAGWPGVFLINVPVVAVAAFGVARLVPEYRDPHGLPVDPLAAVLVTLGMIALTLAVLAAGEHGFTAPQVPVGAAVGLLALGGFVLRQRRSRNPMVDFTLYRNPAFAGASAAATLLTMGTGSGLFVLSQYLQQVQGHNALGAGVAIIPLAVGTVLGAALGARALPRLGSKHSVAIGLLSTAAAFVVLATLDPQSPYWLLGTGLLLGGLGTGFAGPAVNSTVLGAVPVNRAGMGSALNDTHQQLGIALGVAVLGSLLAARYRAGLTELSGVDDRSLGSTLASATDRPDVVAIARDAFTDAQSLTMLIAAGLAAAGAIAAYATIPHTARAGTDATITS